MAYFEWADDMVIDNGPIDADHRRLIDQVNTLHTATSQGRGQDVVMQLLASVIGDTQEHLRREEQLMAQAKFPNLERHKQGHAKFVEQLHDLQQKQQNGSITVASQLSTVLRDWLSLHIRRGDKELMQFLRQQERLQRPQHPQRPPIR
ncbi:MAG: bacteriohemerythrin [Simplicispira sp.]|nr:bacteriohemerythrin [Simplicispira sp.]